MKEKQRKGKEREREERAEKKIESTKPHFTQVSVT